ncbi:MAG: putative holin [Mycobacterium sp.]|uniref:putative holin n=1 Tax=Mycobacterium sp. TaxID=1785 RepID=UPI003BB4EB7B
MIPLPRNWALASAMLLGLAAGVLGAAAALTVDHARMRPDIAIALVVGFPTVVGLLVVLLSRRRWLTALGLFVLAVAPGWFGVLAVIEVVTRG